LLTFENDKPVIVGFSGGGDSVSLLYILKQLGYDCIAAHCNFHLRGNESNQDEAFCREFAAQHDIRFVKVDFDTQSHAAQNHISIEMAARELRYAWFETLREKYDAQAIAVAHHRDDSNETMLLNMIRGTGIRGLCGIRPRNGLIIRPLLCVGKDDISRFLDEQHLPFVTDSSNLSDEYTRNFIRLRILPLMQEVNPSVEEALARTAAHLADVENIYLQTIENAKTQLLKQTEPDVFNIPIAKLLRQPSPQTILYELLRPFGFTRTLSENIFNSLPGESGKIFETPDSGYLLLKDRTSLFIYKKQEETTAIYKIEENETDFENLPVHLSFRKVEINTAFEIDKSPLTATFDYDKIKFPLLLRKWRPGDWFIPFGMKGRKKISDYFSDHKFTLYQKNKTWLLCSKNDILWIVGERADNRFCVDNHTKNALVINFFSKNY
jgi:tRNA(Ile)-lysidine synthase